MRLLTILVALLFLFGGLVCYAALVAASDCDDEDDLFDGIDDFDEIIAAAEQRGWNKGYDDCLKDLTYGTIRTRERSDNE